MTYKGYGIELFGSSYQVSWVGEDGWSHEQGGFPSVRDAKEWINNEEYLAWEAEQVEDEESA